MSYLPALALMASLNPSVMVHLKFPATIPACCSRSASAARRYRTVSRNAACGCASTCRARTTASSGFLIAGPISGRLSDRYGSRPFATGGMIAAAVAFVLLELLPINFSYPAFAAILLLNGLAMGAFAAPNRAGVMNSLPARDRGAGGGMNSTFMNSAQVF